MPDGTCVSPRAGTRAIFRDGGRGYTALLGGPEPMTTSRTHQGPAENLRLQRCAEIIKTENSFVR